MKVSIFVHDLSSNPIVRVAPIAKAMQNLGYEVEILGFTLNSDNIYTPYKDTFKYKTIRSYNDIRWFIINSIKLSKLADGDIVYAFKPLWSSFFPALLASGFGFRKKLLLDVEDNEYWEERELPQWQQIKKHPWYPKNKIYIKLLFPFTFFAKHKTVVCKSLQKKYGGTIILHGPDTEKHNPEILPDRSILRKKYQIPENVNVLLFAGRPVSYNGLDTVIEILKDARTKDWNLVLAGNPDFELFKVAKMTLGERCHILGSLPNAQMPEVLKIADVIPILQKPCPATEMQIPAKLIEALSMGKSILATDVCDLKEILAYAGQNNNVLSNKDIIEGAIKFLISWNINQETEKLSINYFLRNASITANANTLKSIINA